MTDSSHPSGGARIAGQWTNGQLTDGELTHLASLPAERTICDRTIKLVHGTPGDQDGRLYPEEYESDLITDERLLVHGHTHIQHIAEFAAEKILNPGSVGHPRDGDPQAAYAILDLDDFTADLQRVEYPIDEVTERIRATAIPNQLCEWLRYGEIVNDHLA